MFTAADDEGRQRVAVVGNTVVLNNLGITTPEALVGEQVRIRGTQFTVVGVLAPKGAANAFQNPDDEILVPIQTARFRVNGSDRLQSISALAQTEEQIPDAMADIQRVLRRAASAFARARRTISRSAISPTFSTTTQETTAGHDVPAVGYRRRLAARRRHRHHEHHARVGHGAHARDRHSQGARRDALQHPASVLDRSRGALHARRNHWNRTWRGRRGDHEQDGGLVDAGVERLRSCSRSPSRRSSAWRSVCGRRGARRCSIRSSLCATSKRSCARLEKAGRIQRPAFFVSAPESSSSRGEFGQRVM